MSRTTDITIRQCCICGQAFMGIGYMPYPVKERGDCCYNCANGIVEKAKQRESEYGR